MIKNIFRLKNNLVVTLENGKEYETNQCTDELYKSVMKLLNKKGSDKELAKLFFPKQEKVKENYEAIQNSSILEVKDGSAYMPSISNLTVPQMLADKIVEAEKNNDENALTAYKNFWTLLSLNPNTAVRNNLFWFLEKWGMSICKSGLFVAYRNVELKSQGIKYDQKLTAYVGDKYYQLKNDKKDPKDYNVIVSPVDEGYDICRISECTDDILNIGNLSTLYENIVFTSDEAGTVYTDNRTHKMEIRLGHIVSIPRSQCDENVEACCSHGLHAAGQGWLKYNYYGNIGIKVLINPANVCSCPKVWDFQ